MAASLVAITATISATAATISPPALPQVFMSTVNTVATSCFVQCPTNCSGKNVVPSCPIHPNSFDTAQRAYNYYTNRSWESKYETGLKQNSSSITDCVSGLSYQLDPFRYPSMHVVCSGYPAGFNPPSLPASGAPQGNGPSPNGPFVIPAGAIKLGESTIRDTPCMHWRYTAPANASVGDHRPAGAGQFRWHFEDYFLSTRTGLPLRIALDESVHWDDHEYQNYTTWDKISRDYIDFRELKGREANALFEVSELHCKLMLAPPSPASGPAADEAAVSDAMVRHVNSQEGLSWTAGQSERWAGATHEDVRATMGLPGFRARMHIPTPRSDAYNVVTSRVATLPEAWDFRTAFPECIWAKTIVDQGGCGSCWAWAATGVLASRFCMATKGKVNVRMSPQYLLDCNTQDEMGCGGGALDNVWRYLTTAEHYVVTEECDPYTGQDGKECPTKCANSSIPYRKYMATTSTPWTPSLEATEAGGRVVVAEMQQELMMHGPLEAGIELFQDFASYKSGVYTLSVNASYGGGHAVEIIGWGSDTLKSGEKIDYWTVQNTYGTSWGEKGYFRIRRGTNEIGIEQEVIAGRPLLR
eukprot:SAG31_NODE_869_length_11344_cov_15.137839_7_plen_585_part_00